MRIGAVLLASAALASAGCDGSGQCGPARGRVSRAVDGDTIELGGGERVRYLLVDAPESAGQAECYGAEAARLNAALVEGAEVDLDYDRVCEDDYGRLLAYVAVRGREINALLVERGAGCTLYIPPNGADRRGEFEALQVEARSAGRGLWGACADDPCR